MTVELKVAAVMPRHRELAYALLRLALGVIFITTSVVKFSMGLGTFTAGLQQQFAGKLPMFVVTAFGHVLPFVELTLGVLLILGFFNVIALVLANTLLIVLTFGKVIVNDAEAVAHNLLYVLIGFVLLWLAEYNRYSIEYWRGLNRDLR